jgi:outer membrane protein OmpA-like peptidoglycan-associated protein
VVIIYSLGNLLGAMGDGDRELYSSRLGVRDAPVIVARTRHGPDGRLAFDGLSVTPFWIADPLPTAQWWPAGFQALVRPLSVRRELARLGRSRCGRPCEVRARQYRRRAALTRRAFDVGDVAASAAAPAVAAPPIEQLPEPEPEPVAIALPPPPPPPEPEPVAQQPAPAEPPTAPEPPPPAAGDGDLRSRLAQGEVLPVRFRRDAMAIEEVVDEETIRQIVGLLLEDHSLRIELEGYAAPDEELLPHATLGRRRALAAKHLIAAMGPSRSRFSVSSGEPGGGGRPGTAHVVIRVVPR